MPTLQADAPGRKTAVHKAPKQPQQPDLPLPDNTKRNRFRRRREVAALLRIHTDTLVDMWNKGLGPTRRQLTPKFDGSTDGDIIDYLEACKVS